MEIVKSIQRIQERFVEESSSNPSPEKRCASRLEEKGKIVEKKKEKEEFYEKFYEKRSINSNLVSSVMLFQEVSKLKANYPKT